MSVVTVGAHTKGDALALSMAGNDPRLAIEAALAGGEVATVQFFFNDTSPIFRVFSSANATLALQDVERQVLQRLEASGPVSEVVVQGGDSKLRSRLRYLLSDWLRRMYAS